MITMASNQKFSLRWNNYHNHITYSFDTLRSENTLVDVTLSCEGKKIYAHKILLSACSTYFKEIFHENPCQHPIIIFKNVKFTDLESIVEFMYQGEVNVLQDSLPSFLHTAELLAIKGLTEGNVPERIPKLTEKNSEHDKIDLHKPSEIEFLLTEPSITQEPEIVQIETTSSTDAARENNLQKVASTVSTIKREISETAILPTKTQNKPKRRKQHFRAATETTQAILTIGGYTRQDDNSQTSMDDEDDDEVHDMEFMPTMKMEIPDYIELSRPPNNVPNESNSGNMSTTFIQEETYELVGDSDMKTDDIDHGLGNDGNEGDEKSYQQQEADKQDGVIDIVKSLFEQSPTSKTIHGSWICDVCSHTFNSMSSLKRHNLSKHSKSTAIYKCELCKAVYKTKWSLSTHKSKYHRSK